MKSTLTRLLFLLLVATGALSVPQCALAQETAALEGRVRDAASGDPLVGARVEVIETKRGAIVDAEGHYIIKELPGGATSVEVRLLGYAPLRKSVTLIAGETTRLDFSLKEQRLERGDVVVQGDRQREIDRTTVSRITLDPKLINSVPAIGGESDLFRVLQLMPGIKSLSEISSGLYVRGGAPDQNLILLDNNVVYNPSHLFGFFSTFNTDAIKDVDLSKGGYPAQYGGRLTGVLNVTTREGNKNELHGKTSVSLISARQTLEFPLLNGSALISARRTYIDAFIDLTGADNLLSDGTKLPRYYFYDLNAKIDQNLGQYDKLSLSGYLGADNLHYPENGFVNINLTWGNQVAGAEWTHVFSPDLFCKTFVGYSAYSSNSNGTVTANPFEFANGIQEITGKQEVDWHASDGHDMKVGGSLSRFSFDFYNKLGSTNKPLKDTGGVPYYLTLFAQDEWRPTDRITANYGVRAEWLDLAEAVTIDPRLTVSYQLSPLWTLKASTGIYHQFLHLVSIGEFTFFDLWVPGTSPIPPSMSTQYILGISGYPTENYYASCEIYYKRLKNIVEYNQTKFLSNDLNELFPRGTGNAYGIELFLQKRIGDLTGWLGYTLSWVNEKFDQMNGGEAFSPKYDQRHDVQVVLNYQFSERWQAGLTWTYATGQAYTSSLGYYHLGFDEIGYSRDFDVPGKLGAQRLPDYHRADASVTYSFRLFGQSAKASLDIFNVYSHRNVWFRVVDTDKQPPVVSDVLLLPIIPTIGLEVTY